MMRPSSILFPCLFGMVLWTLGNIMVFSPRVVPPCPHARHSAYFCPDCGRCFACQHPQHLRGGLWYWECPGKGVLVRTNGAGEIVERLPK